MWSPCLSSSYHTLAPKKAFIYKNIMQKQFPWVQKQVSWIRAQHDLVVLSGESYLNLHGSDCERYGRRRKREAYPKDCISPTMKFLVHQIAWEIISSKAIGRLKLLLNISFHRHLEGEFKDSYSK